MLHIHILVIRQSSFRPLYSNEEVYAMDSTSYYFPRLRWLNAKEIGIVKEYGIFHEGDDFYLIYPHELYYVERGRITIYCSFDFSDFPFDSHTCDLNMGKLHM